MLYSYSYIQIEEWLYPVSVSLDIDRTNICLYHPSIIRLLFMNAPT